LVYVLVVITRAAREVKSPLVIEPAENGFCLVWSVYGFGLALPTVEALIGAAVAIEFRTRVALSAGTVLMLAVMFDTTLRQDWATAGIQLNYSFIYCLLLAGIQFDHYGADSLFHRGS
jgi:thiosulfate dehydrogenase (quinone) large subunit